MMFMMFWCMMYNVHDDVLVHGAQDVLVFMHDVSIMMFWYTIFEIFWCMYMILFKILYSRRCHVYFIVLEFHQNQLNPSRECF